MFRVVLLTLAIAVVAPVSASDRTSPDSLRNKHAGTKDFASTDTVEILFPKLLKAASDCWIGEVEAGAATIGGGALGTLQSASREVLSELSPSRTEAYVIVRAVGFFGGFENNILQIDLTQRPDSTLVQIYHRNKAKGQREFFGEVERWLVGDLKYCEDKPLMAKKKESK